MKRIMLRSLGILAVAISLCGPTAAQTSKHETEWFVLAYGTDHLFRCMPIHGYGMVMETNLFGPDGMNTPEDFERFLNHWETKAVVRLEWDDEKRVGVKYHITAPNAEERFQLAYQGIKRCEYIRAGMTQRFPR